MDAQGLSQRHGHPGGSTLFGCQFPSIGMRQFSRYKLVTIGPHWQSQSHTQAQEGRGDKISSEGVQLATGSLLAAPQRSAERRANSSLAQ